MPGTYTHTTRTTGTTLTASIYNADHQNHIDHFEPQYIDDYSTNLAAMQTKTDPGESGSESLPTTLGGELERLRYAIYDAKLAIDPGITYWYETPVGIGFANVKAYGATGDGSTDDLTAIRSAVAALSSGGTLYFPPGTYMVTGHIAIPYSGVTVVGAGRTATTIRAKSSFSSTSRAVLSIGYDTSFAGTAVSNISVRDLTLDGNDLGRPLQGRQITNAFIYNVRAENSTRAAAQFFASTDVTVMCCQLEDSNAADQFGDGLYFGACVRPKALFNYVYDFKRIGIVTEAESGVKSEDAFIMGNYVAYGHDSTAPEANAGIWCENTKGAKIVGNTLTNLYNNPAGSVYGIIVATGAGSSTYPTFIVRDNIIDDVGYGIFLNPQSTEYRIVVEGNTIKAGATHTTYLAGVIVESGGAITIARNTFGPVTHVNSSDGSIVIPTTITNIDSLTIDDNDCTRVTHVTLSADLNITNLNSNALTTLRLLNQTCKVIMRATHFPTTTIIDNCDLTTDGATYPAFGATTLLRMSNSSFNQTGGSALYSCYYTAGANYYFNNCHFTTWKNTIATDSATVFNLFFTNCFFGSGSFIHLNSAAYMQFSNCQMNEYRTYANNAFLYGNQKNAVWYLFLNNCTFISSTAEEPLKLHTTQPTGFAATNCYAPTALTRLTRSFGTFIGAGTVPHDVVATADLPTGATAQNGRILIEDAGAGDRNIILYAGGERFRIDGGAAV